MFSKLLKHEWKANAGLLGILSLCALGVGLLGAGVLRGIQYAAEKGDNNGLAIVGASSLSGMMVFIVIALVAYALAVQFINLFRFYKNKFTDQGYLTFTLPVGAHEIFLSSFLVNLAWLAISVVVLVIAVAIMVLLGAGNGLKEMGTELRPILDSMGEMLSDQPGYGLYSALNVTKQLVAPLYSLVLLMTSITLGCVLAKKHKIWMTIGMYYGISMAVGIVETVLTAVPTVLMLGNELRGGDQQYFHYMSASTALSIVLQLCLMVGGYCLSTWLMNRKLNLP